METQRSSWPSRLTSLPTRLAAATALASLLSACATTTQGQIALQQETPAGQTAPNGAAQFLGNNASLLKPGGKGQPDWIYIAPKVQWSNYKEVLLKPVEFWDTPDNSVSSGNQQMLTSYFYNALQKNLKEHCTLAEQPGPGTITIKVAIINADAATPGLRSASLVLPQARLLDYAQSLFSGHAAFAGSAEAAFMVTDSSTGQLLAEAVDKRIGGMAINDVAQMRWSDAEAAMNYWAKKLAQRLTVVDAGTSSDADQSKSRS
jgi:hypothetical protein